MLSVLEERGFPVNNIAAVASERSSGQSISYGESHILAVQS